MRHTTTTFWALGIIAFLAGTAFAQRGSGPYGGAYSVQPGVPATRPNPVFSPVAPQITRVPGFSPSFGAFNGRPQVLTVTVPSFPGTVGRPGGFGPYGGFYSVQPPSFNPNRSFNGGAIIPGNGFAVVSTPFGVASAPLSPFGAGPDLTVVTTLGNPRLNGVAFDRFVGGLGAGPGGAFRPGNVVTPTRPGGSGPYGGAASVAPAGIAPAPPGPSAPNPAFARFFSGLNGAASR
jgi:hypothetical protein